MRISREPRLGSLRNGGILYAVGWLVTGLASLMSVSFVLSQIIGS